MPTSIEDLESYLTRLDRRFERVDDSTYLISLGPNQPLAALRVAQPVVVIQVDVGPAPAAGEGALRLYRRLLELNATDLLHVAYGVERDRIVLSAALELPTLDINELEAVLANIDLSLASHVPELRSLSK
jgi:hypothetical protein